MSKHPNRKPVSRREVVRVVESLVNHAQMLSQRIDDIELVFSNYLEYMKQDKKFGKFLDGKYKRDSDIGSGTGSSPSKE
jgi:hypothetical protein|tara:strand:- start:14 stop:250 length:237 start_codon:yes stop_codon:yes gene_type:complete